MVIVQRVDHNQLQGATGVIEVQGHLCKGMHNFYEGRHPASIIFLPLQEFFY